MEDPYTKELPRHIGYKNDKELEHVLIIGGGDCLIANHLCKRFPNIRKITMCELDKRVVENVM
jgi:spermidine synthase